MRCPRDLHGGLCPRRRYAVRGNARGLKARGSLSLGIGSYLEIENSAGHSGGDAICALENPRPGTVLPPLIHSAPGTHIQALGENGDLSSRLGGLRAFVKFEHFSVFFLNYPLSRLYLDPVRVQCDTIEAIGFISFGRVGAGKACQFR